VHVAFVSLSSVCSSVLSSHLSSLLKGFLEVSHHVEAGFWVVVTSSLEEGSETFNSLAQVDESSWLSRELLRHEEWLGKEFDDLSSSGDGKLILFVKFVHTQNSNDILERLVVLQQLLDTSGDSVVSVSDNGGIKHSGSGFEWVDGWINSQLSQGSGQHSGGIQVSEGGGWSWISDIISWYIDGLYGGDGSSLGGGNSFLEGTQIGSEGWLISDSGWDTSKKGRHLRAGLGESEDVVDEKQHILVLLVSEVLSDGETGKTNSGSGTWWLVHLSVDKSGLGSWAIGLDDTGLNHFVVKIVTLSGSLSDSSEDRVTSMLFGDVVNQLHNKYSFSYTGTTEKSNFTSLVIRGH